MQPFETLRVSFECGTIDRVVQLPADEKDPMKYLDRFSVQRFLDRHRDKVTGDVLDYGCGKFAVPEHLRYRQWVLDAGARHHPWDPFNAREWAGELIRIIATESNYFDTILSVQMLMECESPAFSLLEMYRLLKPGGHVLLTYQTNWREADANDKYRWTRAGMENLVTRNTSFEIVDHVRRAEVTLGGGYRYAIGYGIALRKP